MELVMLRDLNYYTDEMPESMTEKEVINLFQTFFKYDSHHNSNNIKILLLPIIREK